MKIFVQELGDAARQRQEVLNLSNRKLNHSTFLGALEDSDFPWSPLFVLSLGFVTSGDSSLKIRS